MVVVVMVVVVYKQGANVDIRLRKTWIQSSLE